MAAHGEIQTSHRKLTLTPAETVADSIRKSIAFGVAALARNQVAAETGDAESLHQLRVAWRRLRASIEFFSTSLYAAQLAAYRRDLKWITAQTGLVRECDVNSGLLNDRSAKIDPELATAIAPIVEALATRRKEEHAKLYEMLASRRYRNLTARLSKASIKRAGAERQIGFAAADMLKPMMREVIRRGDKLDDEVPARKFHKQRVRIKRMRYVLEMLEQLGAKQHKKTLRCLESLQDGLGAYHDTIVASDWLRSYAQNSNLPTKTVLAAGALIHSLGNYGNKLRRRSLKAWRQFARSDSLHDTRDEIRRAGKLAPAAEPLTEPIPIPQSPAVEEQSAPEASENRINQPGPASTPNADASP